jgi:glycosyltransferase involved in cell wall biosynthesis
MRKIKVAFLGGYPPQSDNLRGGVQAAVAYLLRGLTRLDDLELHALLPRPSGCQGPEQFDENGVLVHIIPHFQRYERLRNYRLFQSTVNEVLSMIQPDIIHAQEAGAEALVALRSRVPTVVTAHGIRAEDTKYITSLARRLRFYYDSYLTERSVIKQVNYLVAISQYVTNYFSSQFKPDIQIRQIPNAVDEQFFEKFNKDSNADILFVGRVVSLKRIHDLVEAFELISQHLPQSMLRIAGDITSEPIYVQAINAQIQHAGLGKRIQLLGQLDQEELIREYQNSALVVLPSAQENYPMVLAQAMAMGKPVIASRVGGVPEMLGQNGERGLLIDVGDVKSLSLSIKNLLMNPTERYSMGQTAHEYALKNFHLEQVAQQTFNFYQYIFAKEKNQYE